MCLTPNLIPNKNYGLNNPLKDCTSKYIKVNCGHCAECIKTKQMALVQRSQMEALNSHLFMCSITYNNDMIPFLEINGFKIRFANVKDVQDMMKRLRKDNAFGIPFRYFAVSELGGLRGRPHFHILFLFEKKYFKDFPDLLSFEMKAFHIVLNYWSINVGSKRSPKYIPLCTFIQRFSRGKLRSTYDFHFVEPSSSGDSTSDVAFYVLKYMLKPSDRAKRLQQALHLNLEPDLYRKVWSTVKPRYFKSLGFGLSGLDSDYQDDIKSYIKDCVEKSKVSENFPCFYNPISGASFPLARYYKNIGQIYNIDDAFYFHDKNFDLDSQTIVDSDKSSSEIIRSLDKFDRLKDLVDSHDTFEDDLNFLFNVSKR